MRRRNATKPLQQAGQVRWRWAPGLIALFVVLALASLNLVRPVEQWPYRQILNTFAPDTDAEKIVVLTVPTEQTAIQPMLAQALERLSRARAVGVMLPLSSPENAQALEVLKGRIEEHEIGNPQIRGEPLPTLYALTRTLDTVSRLKAALQKSGNVILVNPGTPDHGTAFREGRRWDSGSLIAARRVAYVDELPSVIAPTIRGVRDEEPPYPPLIQSARGVGLEGDESAAFSALFASGDKLVPSLLLQLLRLNHEAFRPDRVTFLPDGGIQLGKVTLTTDRAYRFYPYTRIDAGFDELAVIPLAAVAAGEYSSGHFNGKTVLIGFSGDPALAREARAAAAVMQQELVTVPAWSQWGEYAALLVVALLAMFLLPRLGYAAAAVTVLLVTLLLVNGEFLLLVLNRQWLPLMLPLMLLWLGYPVITFRRFFSQRHERLAAELSVANRQLGQMLQSQGDLELAQEKYRRCRVDGDLLEQFYHLGLDFERKRQFSKAESVFKHLASLSKGFRDVDERIQRNQSMAQRIVLANGGAATAEGTVIMSAEGLQNPTVGHYQIERELGRGAMGMVYLGKDPRIGRAVAIKTMALSSEFEGAQLDEVKLRFYREAETAGRLNHPNIVHIYDIGEEQELAYIAMDYLRGKHLGNYTTKENLLPIKEVLMIAGKVAEALEYAHKQNVVHRDIKPANIIYDRDEGSVKVTDFGVACLTDSSKTKTGTVLGSPSYMSPEQVAGKRVDGRADIFSLGVTIYQMITAELPFSADSLGSLMYKIANDAHPRPSKFRKGLPSCVTRIINKCMQKDPQKRYQNGGELAAALKRCQGK